MVCFRAAILFGYGRKPVERRGPGVDVGTSGCQGGIDPSRIELAGADEKLASDTVVLELVYGVGA